VLTLWIHSKQHWQARTVSTQRWSYLDKSISICCMLRKTILLDLCILSAIELFHICFKSADADRQMHDVNPIRNLPTYLESHDPYRHAKALHFLINFYLCGVFNANTSKVSWATSAGKLHVCIYWWNIMNAKTLCKWVESKNVSIIVVCTHLCRPTNGLQGNKLTDVTKQTVLHWWSL